MGVCMYIYINIQMYKGVKCLSLPAPPFTDRARFIHALSISSTLGEIPSMSLLCVCASTPSHHTSTVQCGIDVAE